jgi:hypothetical protein
VDPDWQWEGEGEEKKQGRVGRPGGKRSGLSPQEDGNFLFIQIKFKQPRTVLIQKWTYEALEIPNKIWLESV